MNALLTYLKTIWWAVLRRPVIAYCHFYGTLPFPQGSSNVLIASNLITGGRGYEITEHFDVGPEVHFANTPDPDFAVGPASDVHRPKGKKLGERFADRTSCEHGQQQCSICDIRDLRVPGITKWADRMEQRWADKVNGPADPKDGDESP